CVRVDSNYDYW
nr:immunoglobulin heavy chain junction region [Macaca mulatta]MOV48539.1 immunoglobulin heavy chain junction region [Macaca mulatta]